jgi:hypothetical protein
MQLSLKRLALIIIRVGINIPWQAEDLWQELLIISKHTVTNLLVLILVPAFLYLCY